MTPDNLNACAMEAAAAIIAGNRMIARLNVESALGQSRDDLNYWLLYAWTSDSPSGSELAVNRALELDPSNELALAGKKWLQGIQNLVVEMVEESDAQQSSEELEESLADDAISKAPASTTVSESKGSDPAAQATEAVIRDCDDTTLVEDVRTALLQTVDDMQPEEQATENSESDEQEPENTKIDQQPDTEIVKEVAEPIEVAESVDQTNSESEESDDTEAQIAIQINEISQEVNNAVELKAEETSTQFGDADLDDATSASDPLVMVVDDSAAIRKLVTIALGGNGFEVVSAADGMEALNLMDERKPDLVLSSVEMPRLGGYQLCRSMRKQPATEQTPILLLTGKDSVIEKMRGKMAGANGSISKPLESKSLVSKVRECLTPVAT